MKIKLFKNNLDGTIPSMQMNCANCFYKMYSGCTAHSHRKGVKMHFENPVEIEDPEHSFCKEWMPDSSKTIGMPKKAIKKHEPELIKIFEVK